MCFSAVGSFAVAGVLTGAGAVSLAQTHSSPLRMFAAAPLLFGAQQAAEGIVWLTLPGGARTTMHATAVMAFLGFALVVWPWYVPFSLRLMERDSVRRRALAALSLVGVTVSAVAAVLLARYQPVASIVGHSIRYSYGLRGDAALELLLLVAYVVPTVLPFFVSTTRLARTIGLTLAASLVVTVLVEYSALTSVWCFFAAILSGQILVAVRRNQRTSTVLEGGLAPALP